MSVYLIADDRNTSVFCVGILPQSSGVLSYVPENKICVIYYFSVWFLSSLARSRSTFWPLKALRLISVA